MIVEVDERPWIEELVDSANAKLLVLDSDEAYLACEATVLSPRVVVLLIPITYEIELSCDARLLELGTAALLPVAEEMKPEGKARGLKNEVGTLELDKEIEPICDASFVEPEGGTPLVLDE